MPETTVEGVSGNQITDEFCKNQFVAFDDRDRFNEVGGWSKMNDALRSEWVLVMSLWDDVSKGPVVDLTFWFPGQCILTLDLKHYANMLWLDSSYPPEKAGQPGGDRGDCPQDSGVPADVESQYGSVRSPMYSKTYNSLTESMHRLPSLTATSASGPLGPPSTFELVSCKFCLPRLFISVGSNHRAV